MMSKLRHSAEQIIRKLRQADVLLGQGKTVELVCRELKISDASYYKWRQRYT
jgi:putative transposase